MNLYSTFEMNSVSCATCYKNPKWSQKDILEPNFYLNYVLFYLCMYCNR